MPKRRLMPRIASASRYNSFTTVRRLLRCCSDVETPAARRLQLSAFEYHFEDVPRGFHSRVPTNLLQTARHQSYRGLQLSARERERLRARLRLFGWQAWRPLFLVIVSEDGGATVAELEALTTLASVLQRLAVGQARDHRAACI